ncbi:C-factor isoform X2 [Nilaparvata lugens]|uniref:C-factor isoform X2 n=1 Tax=Nilaparvata lugens TaxID=108931 RepID=UPI00193D33B9|nr:C-factor isoform X2 [Nilaparvata lugens]
MSKSSTSKNVKDFDSYKDVVKQVQDVVGDAGLNLLVNNAGVSSKFTRVNLVKADQMTDNFLVNSVAPLMLTKASLNAITRSLSFDLKEDKVLVVSIHPGWIKTDMGGKQAPLEIDQAVPQIIQLFNTMSQSHNGGFYQYDGKQLPW